MNVSLLRPWSGLPARSRVLREVMCSKLPGRIAEMLLCVKSSLVMLLSIRDKGSSVKPQWLQSSVVSILLQHDCPELDITNWTPAITKNGSFTINRVMFRFHEPLCTEMFNNYLFQVTTSQIRSWNPETILSKTAVEQSTETCFMHNTWRKCHI